MYHVAMTSYFIIIIIHNLNVEHSAEVCPIIPPGTGGICVEACSSDDNCPNGQLCCFNGCGRVCMPGVSGEEDTDHYNSVLMCTQHTQCHVDTFRHVNTV